MKRLLVSLLLVPAVSFAGQTCRGNIEECEWTDKYRVPIEIYKITDEKQLTKLCGAFAAEGGCAARGKDKCMIVINANYPNQKKLLMHEMNHCKGWDHKNWKAGAEHGSDREIWKLNKIAK